MRFDPTTLPVGTKFGRLSFVRFIRRNGTPIFICTCECSPGTEREFIMWNLRNGHTKSCGCLSREVSGNRARTHGRTRTTEWNAWQSLQLRCEHPSHENYRFYGGRGICVCAGFKSFDVFFGILGCKPTPQHQIDRIDSNGHYSCGKCDECAANGWPANCRWATKAEQSANMRSNRMIKFDGQTKHLAEWARCKGIDADTLSARLCSGWSVSDALTIPTGARRSRKLTDAMVASVRDRISAGDTFASIARSYGVCRSTIRGISTGRLYSRID